jgi:hypothetical protein
MADCKARHTTLLRLLGRLDRVLVAGRHRLLAAANESPPAGPGHVQQGDASESLGAVAFVGVVDAVRERWRTSFPRECVLPYRGMGLIQPGYAMTPCNASMQTYGRLKPLGVRDVTAVSIVSVEIAGADQLHNISDVGLLISVALHGSVLLDLITIESLNGVSTADGLKGLTAFLVRPDDIRIPRLISIQADCTVKIRIDADLTLVFQPIPACIAAIEG